MQQAKTPPPVAAPKGAIHGVTTLGHTVYVRTEDHHHPGETHYAHMNKHIAMWITRNIGTMSAFWAFNFLAGLSLPATLVLMGWVPKTIPYVPGFFLSMGWIYLIQWIAQSYTQLVLLPAIMVGQSLQNQASDARATKSFEDLAQAKTDIEKVIDLLRLDTTGGLADLYDQLHAEIQALGGPAKL